MMNLVTVSIPQAFDGHPLSTKTNLSVFGLALRLSGHLSCNLLPFLPYMYLISSHVHFRIISRAMWMLNMLLVFLQSIAEKHSSSIDSY